MSSENKQTGDKPVLVIYKQNIVRSIITIGLILLLILGVYNINEKILSAPSKEDKIRVTVIQHPLVKHLSVKNENILPSVMTQGIVSSAEKIIVALEGKGTLKSSIGLREGTKFKKGQVIASIVDGQSQANYKSLLSGFDRNVTQILVDIELEHPLELNKWTKFKGQLSQGKLPAFPTITNNKLNNFLSAKGIIKEYYDLQAVQTTLTKRSFKAPFNGVITTVNVEQGSFVNGNTQVCTIVPQGKLEISFSLSGDYDFVKEGTKVSVIAQDEVIQASIDRENNVLDNLTQQKEFFVTVRNPSLKLGEFVNIKVETSNVKSKAMLLPTPLVFKGNVFGVSSDSILHSKGVEVLGMRNDSLIVSGLKDGELILSESYTNFNDGQKVRLQ